MVDTQPVKFEKKNTENQEAPLFYPFIGIINLSTLQWKEQNQKSYFGFNFYKEKPFKRQPEERSVVLSKK